ncbi:MAG TPA: TonB-dependent receptor plug domain-containing protein [Longimicrobiales bacterium]|nr:TonB-dependent receptor plug domain-containing protein [Longimicrobiales bacterium]
MATGAAVLSGARVPVAGQAVGTLVGRVTTASGAAVQGACVSVTAEGGGRACAGPDGTFLLQGVTRGVVRVRVDAPGYQVAQRDVMVRGGVVIVDVELDPLGVNLDEIVVSAVRRREHGAAVGSVQRDVVTDLDGIAWALRATLAGLRGAPGGGQVGTGLGIRARGPTSVTGGIAPLVYLDGIRLATAPVPTPAGANQSVPILSMLDPADVERIEVLRGAAATARYGMEAGSGVILIYTRQGRR